MKRLLITGTSRGIGQAIATALRKRGDRVIGLSRHPTASSPDEFALDLADGHSIGSRIATLRSAVGAGTPFDGVVLNAGIARREYLESATHIAQQIQVNALGHYTLFMALVREKMLNPSLCNVVNIISKTAFEANPEQIGYCASKAVQHMLFSGIAKSLAKQNVLVNHLIPGPVDTEMNPKREDESEWIDPRKAPELVVPAVMFLLDQPKTGPIDRILDLRRW